VEAYGAAWLAASPAADFPPQFLAALARLEAAGAAVPVIEELVGHAIKQGIVTNPVTVEELFVPSTRGLSG